MSNITRRSILIAAVGAALAPLLKWLPKRTTSRVIFSAPPSAYSGLEVGANGLRLYMTVNGKQTVLPAELTEYVGQSPDGNFKWGRRHWVSTRFHNNRVEFFVDGKLVEPSAG